MKIGEAINLIDTLKPNVYTPEDKIRWLSMIDGQIYKTVVLTHEDGEYKRLRETVTNPVTGENEEMIVRGIKPYEESMDLETELLVKYPYDHVYVSWLESRIDYANGEYAKFNNSNAAYNAELEDFLRWYNRNHMPIGTKFRYF